MALSDYQSYILFSAVILMSYIFPSFDDRLTIKLWNGKSFNRLFTYLLFLILFLVLTYRNCGVDTPTYDYSFKNNRSDSNYDILFFILLRLVRKYTSNVLVWHGVMSGVILLGFFTTAERLKDIVDRKLFYLYLVIYLYFFSFNYTRMMMSIGVLLFAFSLLVSENYKGYIIANIIAGLIHYSSFSVFLIVLLYYLGRKHRRVLLVLGLFTAILIRVRPDIIRYLTFSEHYNTYFSNSLNTTRGIGTILLVIPYFAILYIYEKYLDKRLVTLMYILLIGNVAFSFLGYAILVASRIARFTFAFPCIFLIPYVIKRLGTSGEYNTTTIKILSVLWAGIIYFAVVQSTFETIGIVPYITW